MLEIARRDGWIRVAGDQNASRLSISVLPIMEVEPDEYRAVAKVHCQHFERELNATGLDAFQAISWIFLNVYSYLLRQQQAGYEIYWIEPGDLEHPTYWGVNLVPTAE